MKIWGLDIGASAIKAVKLARSWKGYRIISYGYYPFGSAQNLQEEKQQILNKIFPEKEREKRIIWAFPSHQTMVHTISLPFQERKKNEQVVKFEVEPLLPFPIDEVVADFFPQRNYREQRKALVFAVRKADLQEESSLWRESGLDPESLVPEAVALFWLIKYLRNTEEAGALLDLGAEKATIIFWQNGGLALARSFLLKQDDNFGERLAKEVRRTLITYESQLEGETIKEFLITGGRANSPGIIDKLAADLLRSVNQLNLVQGFPSLESEVPEKYHHTLSVALGCALWQAAAEEEHLNLRREEFASLKKKEKVKWRVSLLITYGIVLMLLGLLVLGIDFYLKDRKYRELKANIRQEFWQANPGVKKVVNEVQQMRNIVQEERTRVRALAGMAKGTTPIEVIYELSRALEPTWKIRVTELTIDLETAEISGEADSFATVNQLKSRLDNSPLFQEGQLKTARASALENIVEFKIQMKIRG